jgi:hypothetical protein
MGVDVAQDQHEITVHTMSPVHGRGPVFYASMPRAAETLKGCGTNAAEDKHRLISTLWDHLAAMESPLWKHCQSSNRAAFPIQVVRGLLGRPHLLLGEYRGPAISFSEDGGNVWAALCGDESDIGIDVAGTDEFHREYPFHRVFHPQELQDALRLADGDLEKASALLWSIKEAVVKALGCAFHLVDPRQITVYPAAERAVEGNGGYTFPVGLSGTTLVRFPIAAGRSLWVRSLPHEKMWLSIALLKGQHRRGDRWRRCRDSSAL